VLWSVDITHNIYKKNLKKERDLLAGWVGLKRERPALEQDRKRC